MAFDDAGKGNAPPKEPSPINHKGFLQGTTEHRLKYCRFAAREDGTPLQRPLKQSFAIRRATVADCAAILECLLTAFAPYRESYTPEAFLDTVLNPDSFRHRLSDMSVVVAISTSGEGVGSVAYKVVEGGER